MRTTTRRASALLAALAMTAAACGGDDAGEDAGGDAAGEGSGDEMAEEDGGDAAGDFELVSEGTLTVCSDVPYAPFEVEDESADSGFSGFDIDLMQAVADDLGLDLAVTAVPFDSITNATAMTRGDCDIAASAITINEDREENVDFTEPYYDSLQSLAVASDGDIASLEDTDGTRLGVQTGTTGEEYARENAPEGAEIVDFSNPGDLFAGLAAGNIDAILQDLPVNAERARTDDSVEVVDEYDTGEQYGFAVVDGRDDGLLEAVDESLDGLREDGTYDELYDQYFATE